MNAQIDVPDSESAARVRAQARLLHDRNAVESALDRMAAAIDRRFGDRTLVYLPVMQGGLIPGGLLAIRLQASLIQDYVHATRYRGDTQGRNLIWRAKPLLPLAGRRVLIVDDILDEGHTLKAIIDYCRREGAHEVASAVLVEKQHARRVPGVCADFIGLRVPDVFVFGYGLDYRERLRNVAGIYATEGMK